jgi:hypothetical protein
MALCQAFLEDYRPTVIPCDHSTFTFSLACGAHAGHDEQSGPVFEWYHAARCLLYCSVSEIGVSKH